MESKEKQTLKIYFRWPLYLGILFVAAAAALFFYDIRIGLVLTAFIAVYYIAVLVFYQIFRKRIRHRLMEFGASYAQIQNEMLREIRIPFVMTDSAGVIIWRNKAFAENFRVKKSGGLLTAVFPELETIRVRPNEPVHVTFEDRKFQLVSCPFGMNEEEGMEEMAELSDSTGSAMHNIYLIDETELLNCKQTLEEEKTVLALIYLDNYEEVMNGVEDVRKSLLSALVERKLGQYVSNVHGVIRKLEKDRFFVVMKQKALWAMEQDNFSLLEDIKTVNIGNDMAVTISIGIGTGGGNNEQNYDYARAAIDMALGRGGDQVVLKNDADVRYFGGKAKSTEKNTRVKARIKAHALRELIEAKESVMIMGHPMSDLDCIGAAVGIYRAARFSGKKASIVLNTTTGSIRPLVEQFTNNSEYSEDMFVNKEQAIAMFRKDMLLVVVDTNRPSYTECPELLQMAENVVVMDHHRQGRESIENALLSYVEPYASSASEMVAEVVQYYDDGLRLRPIEAEAVFAGIVMDTNNFEDKSGVRTFEAAAYLRRCGADAARVRKLFRESMENYRMRAVTIQAAETYKNDFVIAICPPGEDSPNRTVIAAQAANSLLNVEGVRASFVLTEHDGKIYISARSIDEVNVQVLMEKLGGGGHLSIAGAQLTGVTAEEAAAKLKEVIDELYT